MLHIFLLESDIRHILWLISDVSLPTFYTCLEMVTLSNFKDKKYSHVKLFLVGLSCTESNQKKPLFKNESQYIILSFISKYANALN